MKCLNIKLFIVIIMCFLLQLTHTNRTCHWVTYNYSQIDQELLVLFAHLVHLLNSYLSVLLKYLKLGNILALPAFIYLTHIEPFLSTTMNYSCSKVDWVGLGCVWITHGKYIIVGCLTEVWSVFSIIYLSPFPANFEQNLWTEEELTTARSSTSGNLNLRHRLGYTVVQF